MPTSVRDNFINAVMAAVVDIDTRSYYFKSLWRDLTEMMGSAESMDVPEWATALVVEDHVNTTDKAHNALTLQNLDSAKNLLVKDQARGMAVELRNWDKKFNQLGGGGQAYVDEFARKMQVSLRNDRDTRDAAYLANIAAWQSGATPETHINLDGGAMTFLMFQTAMARMLDQPGVSQDTMALLCSSFGAATFRALPQFVANMAGDNGTLGGPGLRRIGAIEGVPIFQGQGIQRGRTVPITASVIAGDVCTATVAAGHGFVVGMQVETAGLTTEADATAVVTATTATSVSFACTAGDGANGVGSLSQRNPTVHNALVNTDRIWQASDPIQSRMIPTEATKTSDTFQLWEDYGRRARLNPSNDEGDPGTVIILHTANNAITVA